MTNFMSALLIGFVLFCVGVKCLAIHFDERAKVASQERYAQAQQEKDARLKADCAKGIGSTIYYKGVYCKG